LEHQNYRNSLFWSSEVLPLQHLMGASYFNNEDPATMATIWAKTPTRGLYKS